MMPDFWLDSLTLPRSVRIMLSVSGIKSCKADLSLSASFSATHTRPQLASGENDNFFVKTFETEDDSLWFHSNAPEDIRGGKMGKCPNTFSLTTEDGVQLCSPFCELSS